MNTSRKVILMNRILTGATIAAVLAFGVAMPSSAAPSTSQMPRRATSERVLAERGAFRRDTPPPTFGADAPTMTEGIAGGFVFVPITPYRTIDTRSYSDGFMLGGDELVFSVLIDESNTTRIPDGAVAITYNLTIDNTVGVGYCALYPGSRVWPGNSSINWTGTGQTIANGGTVAIDFYTDFGQVSAYCGPPANLGTDFIVDVTGYYI
jgi:hypothetical protein